MFVFTDRVIAEIAKDIAEHEPERGGALLGPPANPLIGTFLFDSQASVTSASYVPSSDLVQRVAEKERIEGIELKGVVHSHPGSFDQPSGPDRYAFRRGLDLNPRMAVFLAPILTRDRRADPDVPYEITVNPWSRMTVYAVYRAAIDEPSSLQHEPVPRHEPRTIYDRDRFAEDYGARISPADPPKSWVRRLSKPRAGRGDLVGRGSGHSDLLIETPPCQVMPVEAHVREVIGELAQNGHPVTGEPVWGTLAFNGVHFMSTTFEVDGSEFIVLFPPTYPTSKPILLTTRLTHPREDTREIAFGWGLMDRRSLWQACGAPMLVALSQ